MPHADMKGEIYEKDGQKCRAVFPSGLDIAGEGGDEERKCPGCGDWVNMEEIYESLDGKFYCDPCGEEADDDYRFENEE